MCVVTKVEKKQNQQHIYNCLSYFGLYNCTTTRTEAYTCLTFWFDVSLAPMVTRLLKETFVMVLFKSKWCLISPPSLVFPFKDVHVSIKLAKSWRYRKDPSFCSLQFKFNSLPHLHRKLQKNILSVISLFEFCWPSFCHVRRKTKRNEKKQNSSRGKLRDRGKRNGYTRFHRTNPTSNLKVFFLLLFLHYFIFTETWRCLMEQNLMCRDTLTFCASLFSSWWEVILLLYTFLCRKIIEDKSN